MVQRGKLSSEARINRILESIEQMLNNTGIDRATALEKLKEAEEKDPFKILIGTILSHRTRDENTTKAVKKLFSKYKNAEELAKADEREVRELIKEVGFYNVKAKNIIKVSQQIIGDFNGKVPDNINDLLKFRSVGRKTANCVLVYGFNKPAIPVDTHVHRISNRLGLVRTSKPEDTEIELMKKIPEKYWLKLNDTFVRFGQTICRPVKPRCNLCNLRNICLYYKHEIKNRNTPKI